jgi:RimJ/RimL family protein N-acetyltransferase
MDNNTDLSEVVGIEHEHRPVHNVGLKLLTPINPDTYTRMQWLWEKLKTQDYAFDDFGRGDIEVFAMSLLDSGSLHFEIGSSGYVVVRNLRYSDNPSVHFCIWDRGMAFKEITAAGRELIDFLFRKLRVARISATIPVYNKPAEKLAMMLGFKFEGAIRDGILFHEQHYNLNLYGMLRKEWERK